MSARSIRRAAERKLAKRARQAARNNQPQQPQPLVAVAAATTAVEAQAEFSSKETTTMQTTSTPEAMVLAAGASAGGAAAAPAIPSVEISEARLNANRANAQLSTGPRSSAGKSKVSLNAVKTGLTGQTVVLPSEDIAAYKAHVARTMSKYKPFADDEEILTQSIADTDWRLARIPSLEAAILAIGLREFAGEFEDEPNPETRKALIRGRVMLHYRKDLSNLAIQERRLRNHREKDIVELRALQSQRHARRHIQVTSARELLSRAKDANLRDDGFDFSTEELKAFTERSHLFYQRSGVAPDFDEFLNLYRNQQIAA